MKKPTLLVIFLTVFVDLIGFGIVLPLLPTYSRSFGASGMLVGVIFASYSLMQFLFAPVWGALSDRIGRRPIILMSTLGAAISYAVFAYGSTMEGPAALAVILVSRLLAGICGANITVAQAYIADITPPEDRSKRMGLIGMAFGLGFIIGPALAVVALKLFGASGPGWVAAAICATNFVLAWVRLPESWKPGATAASRPARLEQISQTLKRPVVGYLVLVFFLATFGFTCFETTLGLLVQRNFNLGDEASHNTNAILFSFAGIVGALVQAGPVGKLVKRAGEAKLIAVSLVVFAISMAPLPFIHGSGTLSLGALFRPGAWPWLALLGAVGLLAIGSGLTRPPLFGLLSNLTPPSEQGITLGVAQSAGSLARILGPLFSGMLFDRHPSWPYVASAALALITGLITWQMLCRGRALPVVAPSTKQV